MSGTCENYFLYRLPCWNMRETLKTKHQMIWPPIKIIKIKIKIITLQSIPHYLIKGQASFWA
jgi:hypothetical protein